MIKKNKHSKDSILITGKNSRFCSFLKKDLIDYKTYFTSKKSFNILNLKQMKNYLKDKKIKYLIHIAGLSRPMNLHEENIKLSIDLNIIGTANIVKLCDELKIKLIYFSTHYVYPCKTGNYKETDSLYPINNYAWSKLGGEASVHLYKESLILRLAMTAYPFIHKKAIKGAMSSFVFNKTISKLIPLFLDEIGVLNIGGKKRDIYGFAKKFATKKINPIKLSQIKNFPKDSSLDISKLIKLLNRKKINSTKIIL
jgi:dTDP-4-dehydrorhamnose reductase